MGHVREYTKNEVQLFLEDAGFEVLHHYFKNAKKASFFSVKNLSTSLFNKMKTHQVFLARKKR